MKPRDGVWIAALGLLGASIWLRDTGALGASADKLPVLAALPLFFWLAAPWRFQQGQPDGGKILGGWFAAAAFLLFAGAVLDVTLLLALGWTALLWSWLRTRVAASRRPIVFRLLVLPLLAFPWVLHDLQGLAWWFRLSASAVAEGVFTAAGYQVLREGTNLTVQGTTIAVAPACAGLDTLQAMLIAGCAPAFFCFGARGGPGYWVSLALLPAVAWVANTVRILAIATVAVTLGAPFAMGTFHELGGWLVLLLAFALCCGGFSLVQRWLERRAA